MSSVAISAKVTDAAGAISTAFALPGNDAPSSLTMGVTSINATNNSSNGNLLCQKVTLSQAATLQSLSFYVAVVGGNLRLGVYDATGPSNGPGTLVSAAPQITPVAGWNTIAVPQVLLPAGTYWLSWCASTTTLQARVGSGNAAWVGFAYAALPATYFTGGVATGPYAWSFYATLSVGDTSSTFTIALNTPLAGDGSVAGTLNGSGTFQVNSVQTVSATMNSGFAFASWSDATGILSTSSTYTFSLVKNTSLTMNWVVTKGLPGGGGGGIIPSDRMTLWKPGVTYNGGIPNRTTIYTTLSPSGGDDTAIINAAIVAAPDNTVVALTAGTFQINGGGAFIARSNITLRGVGPGNGGLFGTIASDGTYTCTFNPQGTGTFFNKVDRDTNGVQCFGFGPNFNPSSAYTASANLAVGAVKGTKSCIITGNPGLVSGKIVLIDIMTDNHPNVFWGEKHDPAGATFTANCPGTTTLTVSNIQGALSVPLGSTFTYPTPGTTGQTYVIAQTSGPTGGNGVYTLNIPATFSNQTCYAGNGSRRFFNRQDRSLSQLMKVTSFADNGDGTFTVNFETPFHIDFSTTYWAQLTTFAISFVSNVGVEGIYFFGGRNGDGGGNCIALCADNCWIKNCESHYSQGSGINIVSSYRLELRDSYMHESPNPNPGGDGYNCSMNFGSSDCLFENNIMINGNKNIVMRCTGGGNVVAYNYMDDAFGSQYPHSPEAGVNAGHNGTPHMELLEGNYSHNYKGDDFWGSSTYITVHRNWLTGKRAAHPPLNTYVSVQGACSFPYADSAGRVMADVQAGSYFTNFTGNVLGMSGETLYTTTNSCYDAVQVGWAYEILDNFPPTNTVDFWLMGTDQSHQGIDGNSVWVATTYQTQLRQGNWDWNSASQKWHGIGGSNLHGGNPSPPFPSIPASFYLTGKPTFFTTNPWPWVDPITGTTYVLPAKLRFDNNTPNVVL